MLVSPPLQRFIDGFIDDLTPGLREVAEAAHRTLCTAGHPACSALPREAVGEAADLFARRRLRWVEAMLQALRFEASHAAIDGSAATAPDPAEPSTPMDQWSLVDEDQAEAEIEALRTVQLLRNEAEAELRELQALTSSLRGHSEIQPQANPVDADTVAAALWRAVDECGLSGASRLAAIRALAPALGIEAKAAWARAVQELLRRGVEPAAYRAVTPAPARRDDPPATGFDVTQPGAFEALMSAHWAHPHPLAPAVAPAPPGDPPPGDAPPASVQPSGPVPVPSVLGLIRTAQSQARLDAVLDALPVTSGNLVRLHETALTAAARDERDREAIALVGRLFDHLLDDPYLLAPVQALVAKLQPAVLRAALQDAGLVDDPRHPLWRLLDRLGSHVAGWPDLGAAGAAQALQFVARAEPVLQPLWAQAGRDAPLALPGVLGALDALIAAEVEAATRTADAVLARLHRAGDRDAVVRLLRQRVTLHEAQHGPLEPALRGFFTGLWLRVVADAALQGGAAAAEPWLDIADELLQSLQPPASGLQRRQRLQQLPALLQRLQAGLDRVDAAPGARQAVLDLLLARHTALLRESERPPAAPAPAAAGSPGELQWVPTDPAVWTVRRGDTVVDEAALQTIPADLLPTRPGDPPADPRPRRLTDLSLGTWLKLHWRGDWRVMRLLWRDAGGQQVVLGPGLTAAPPGLPVEPPSALTARALQRLADAGLARPLERRRLLERAVDAVLADIRRAGGQPPQPR